MKAPRSPPPRPNETPLATIEVLIPALGDEHLLERALASIAAQTVLPSGVLVVIDQPEHAAHQRVVATFQGQIPNLRALGSEQNRGIQMSTVIGLQALSADWVAFLDHDDELLPDAIRDVLQTIDLSADDLDAVFAGWIVRHVGGLFPATAHFATNFHRNSFFFSPYDAMIDQNFIPHLRVVRRSLLNLAPDRSLDGAQDWYWNLELVRQGRCSVIDTPLYRHYVHRRQFSRVGGYIWIPGLNRVRRQLVGRAPTEYVPLPHYLSAELREALEIVRTHEMPVVVAMGNGEIRATPFSALALAEILGSDSSGVSRVVVLTDRPLTLGPYVRSTWGLSNVRTGLVVMSGARDLDMIRLGLSPFFDDLFCETRMDAAEAGTNGRGFGFLSAFAKWMAPPSTARRRFMLRAGLLLNLEWTRMRAAFPSRASANR